MAENVASATTADASCIPASDMIFSNVSFWVGHQIPQRARLIEEMRQNGATIVTQESQADVRLIDDAKVLGPYLNGDYFSFRFIEDSIRKGVSQPLGRYRVSASSQTEAIQGRNGIMKKRARTKFTEQDDRILYNTVMPIMDLDGPWRGTSVYKGLAQRYPHHTYQSWRSRFVEHLQYRRPYANRTSPAIRTPEPEQMHQKVAADRQRSPKRRRVQELERAPMLNGRLNDNAQLAPQLPPTIFQPAQQRRQSVPPSQGLPNSPPPGGQTNTFEQETTSNILTNDTENVKDATVAHLTQSILVDSELRNAILKHGFTLEQASNIYTAAPYICDTPAEKIDECWSEMAVDYDTVLMHPAEDWKLFWSEVILPAFMKRNELSSEHDLKKHVDRVLKRDKRVSTPKIKIEPDHDKYTPEDKQRERELARARAEAELQLSSDEEDDGHGNGNDDGIRRLVEDTEGESSSVPVALGESCLFYPSFSPVTQRSTVNDSARADQESQRKGDTPQATPDSRLSQGFPKKKLFGRTLYVATSESQQSQSVQVQIEGQVNTEELHTTSTAELEIPSLLNDKRDVTKGTLSISTPEQESTVLENSKEESRNNIKGGGTQPAEVLPYAIQQLTDTQETPESGQRLPKSVTTSQSTAQSSNALSMGNVAISTIPYQIVSSMQSTNASPTEVVGASHSVEEYETARINLVDEGIDDEDEIHSDEAASDTGSEFMAFDEEPERSQLWTAKSFEDASSERGEEERQIDEGNALPLTGAYEDIHDNPAKVIQNQELQTDSDKISDEQQSHDSHIAVATRSNPRRRPHEVETQDLFHATLEEDPTLLEVPPPEGGWEKLGVDETEFEEFDTIIRTTETSVQFDDDDVLDPNEPVRKPSSYPLSESATISSIEDRRPQTPANPHHDAVIDISSDSSSDTESTVSSVSRHSTYHKASLRATIGRDADETDTESEASSDAEDSPPRQESRIQDLQNWFSVQRARYSTLPNPVFHRLASAAAQAATLSLPTAALILRIMTEKFTSSESIRRRQSRERNRPFKPKQNLSDEEARILVPHDTWGVWTIADDKALLSRTIEGVGEVEGKHGVEGTRRRSRFLRARYGAPETATGGSVGREVARQALLESKLEGKAQPKKTGLKDMVI